MFVLSRSDLLFSDSIGESRSFVFSKLDKIGVTPYEAYFQIVEEIVKMEFPC